MVPAEVSRATYSNTDAVLDPADAERNEAFRKKGNEMIAGQAQISNEPTVARAVANAEGLVSHYPLSAVLVVFGVGLAVGVALGSILGGPHTPRPSFGQRTELAAEKLGRQMLDSIAGVLPESLAKYVS